MPTIDAVITEEIDLNSELAKWLLKHNVKIITNIDTRKLILELRHITNPEFIVHSKQDDVRKKLSNLTTTKEQIQKFDSKLIHNSEKKDKKIDLLIVDCGIKKSIYQILQNKGLNIKMVSFTDDIYEISQKNNINSVLISNGPGDPQELLGLVANTKKLIDKVNLFGICLGHQIISLALGFSVKRMNFGHHGSNHGVLDIENNKIIITSQNHNYALMQDSITAESKIKINYINALDGSAEGMFSEERNIYSVQFHPEASPGPHDGYEILEKWFKIITK